MKKLTAILLLAVFLFNTVGYRLVFQVLQSRADAHLTAKLDSGIYNEADLIAVQVPINMPYQVSRPGTERVDGEINVNGKIYKYVKRSVHNDTLTLYCIPHSEKSVLKQQAGEYAGKVSDAPANDNNKKATILKQLIADIDITCATDPVGSIGTKPVANLYHDSGLLRQFLPVNGQPPEITA